MKRGQNLKAILLLITDQQQHVNAYDICMDPADASCMIHPTDDL